MTIAVLRRLHAIIGEAIDDIERIYTSHAHTTASGASSQRQTPENLSHEDPSRGTQATTYPTGHQTTASNSQAYASPPPSPSIAIFSYDPQSPTGPEDYRARGSHIDFPSLDVPCNPTSLSEMLTTHPTVLAAIGKIVAAAGQMTATVQTPFLSLCEASMGYHLPSCMRILEAAHVVEILRESGPDGVHVQAISEKNGVAASKLAHVLRLLATHHLLREVSPDVFALNRLSSLVDSGKTFAQLKQFELDGTPELKYRDTNGIAAFVGLCTDEIQKASAYMTETYYLSPSQETREGTDPARAPFCFAFDTLKTGTGYFGWLEGEVEAMTKVSDDLDQTVETGRGGKFAAARETSQQKHRRLTSERSAKKPYLEKKRPSPINTDTESSSTPKAQPIGNPNRFRLERFGKAMSGTDGWEAPGALLNGFDWQSLPNGSIIVDVGGGIGSTSMLLATAFSSPDEDGVRLKFIIQDRPVVCGMGEKAWQEKCPKLLQSTAQFQVHDFFTPQPVRNAAVFLLRVVLHDWPDDFAQKILLHLREAATQETKLVIADFVLPLACQDDMGRSGGLEDVEGAESSLAPSPLLPNLGKASANVYWMDLTMQVMFNAQERTLRELVTLALSAGWKVIKVTKTPGSLFGNIVAVPVTIPAQQTATADVVFDDNVAASSSLLKSENQIDDELPRAVQKERKYREQIFERASSRCGTPTFGSNTRLSSVEETLARFGGGLIRSKGVGRSVAASHGYFNKGPPPKPATTLSSSMKKKPSPLSIPYSRSSPTPAHSPRKFPPTSPRLEPPFQVQPPASTPAPRVLSRRMSLANIRLTNSQQASMPAPPLPAMRQPPPSPLSPHHPPATLSRRGSLAQLSPGSASQSHTPLPPLPSHIPVRSGGETSPPNHPFRCGTARGPPTTTIPQLMPAIARRASTAQLPPAPLRKRSKTVVMGPNGGGSRLDLDAGVVLRFDNDKKGHGRQFSEASHLPESAGGVNVLAAAARIDRGDFQPRPSSPCA